MCEGGRRGERGKKGRSRPEGGEKGVAVTARQLKRGQAKKESRFEIWIANDKQETERAKPEEQGSLGWY
jgi:hypothetical protein